MNTDTWVWVNGEIRPASVATVSATDRGLMLGDGVFETLTLIKGEPYALTRHLARLRTAASGIGVSLPWDDHHLRRVCAETAEALVSSRGRMRITVTTGPSAPGPRRGVIEPTLLVTVTPSAGWGPSAEVVLSPWVMNERSPVAGIKTGSQLEHVLALEEAIGRGADEAILVNSRGVLAEGTGSNVFLVVAGELSTPGLATGCLPGITRQLVCETVAVVERDDLTIEDLRTAPEAFLTSSTRGVHPISGVDGHSLANTPGPLTSAAMTAFRALQDRTNDP